MTKTIPNLEQLGRFIIEVLSIAHYLNTLLVQSSFVIIVLNRTVRKSHLDQTPALLIYQLSAECLVQGQAGTCLDVSGMNGTLQKVGIKANVSQLFPVVFCLATR